MLPLVLLVLLVMTLGFWLFTPLLQALTPLLSLTWLGWAGLALVVWLFSGASSKELPSKAPGESKGG